MRIELKTSLEPTDKTRGSGSRNENGTKLYGYLRVCPNCDTELYALWSVPYEWVTGEHHWSDPKQKSDEEKYSIYKKELKEIKHSRCPVCGAEPDCDLGTEVSSYPKEETDQWMHNIGWRIRPIEYEKNYEYIRGKHEKDRKEKAIQRAQTLYEEANVPVTDKAEGPKDEISATPEKLKVFLSQLIRLEINIYSLTERLGTLYFEREQIGKRNIQEIGMLTKEYRDALVSAEKHLEEVREKGIKVKRPVEPTPPELKKPRLFNKSKVLIENETAMKQYKDAMAEYQRQMEACNAEEERLTHQAISESEEGLRLAEAQLETQKAAADSAEVPSTALRISADGEIAEAEKCLKESLKARNELYSYNVVYGKYRDIVAISTFYEYLMSGRCTTLEGSNGAYNIYESEIRANMIISQLSEIIRKLDQIEANQYTLYSELRTVNQNLSQISSKMDTAIQALDRIGDNTEQIAYNMEVTAFYTKKNAELTDALGYMAALK